MSRMQITRLRESVLVPGYEEYDLLVTLFNGQVLMHMIVVWQFLSSLYSIHHEYPLQRKKRTRMHSSRMRTARSSIRRGGSPPDTPPEHTPPRADTPWEQTSPRADTPQSRTPLEQTPPRADTPQSRHPPGADTPSPL